MRVRMITVEPYRFIEMESTGKDGQKFYVNMGLPENDGEKLERVFEDNVWCYNKPFTEIDFNSNEIPYFWNEESDEVADKLLNIWNSNPHFDESGWKEVD